MNGQNQDSGVKKFDTKRIALLGLLFALAMVLSLVESMIPIPGPPGIRLGLSNIVVMFALLNLKKRDALSIAVLKALFVMLTRGTVAGALSLSGGLLALGVMTLLLVLSKEKATYLLISVSGAVFHNIGQITAASVIMRTFFWPYLPVLVFSGIVTGIATSILLKLTSPVFLRLRPK
jgi:heptaprenyl diphosphate synthase